MRKKKLTVFRRKIIPNFFEKIINKRKRIPISRFLIIGITSS